MSSLYQLEQKFDKKRSVANMRKELEHLYYYIDNDKTASLQIAEETLDYLPYTKSVIRIEKKEGVDRSSERILKAIEEKDQAIIRNQCLEQERKAIVKELFYGLSLLPEAESKLLEEIYLKHKSKDWICAQQGYSISTLRRKTADAIFHLAVLLHKTIPVE